MISLEEARARIRSHLKPCEAVEIPLADCCGYVLAHDATADAPYPSGDRSTMDGYVIGGEESPGTFRVVGEIAAATVPSRALYPGEAMRIFTGALIPQGGGRVVMQEQAHRAGDQVSLSGFGENRFIRRHASEAAKGSIVVPAGTLITPPEAAILAQLGHIRPRVVRKPRIRHVATGDEIVAPENTPLPGQIRDSNSTLLAALCASSHCPIHHSTRSGDAPDFLDSLPLHDTDLLLISGGASVGDYDFGTAALRRLGFTIVFDKVNLRPGKPLTFATRGSQAAFVIPGNPVSHFVCFHVAIRLALEILSGHPETWNLLPLPVDHPEILSANPRDTFWPAHASIQSGAFTVCPLRWSTSGDSFALARTNALIRIPPDQSPHSPAETLLLHPLSP